MRPKFTIDLEGGIGILGFGGDVITPSFLALAGYRQNYASWFGLHVRAGLVLGIATFDASNSSSSSYSTSESQTDSTSMTGGMLEVLPFFGPFGRFYFGPIIWGGYLNFGSSELYSAPVHEMLESRAFLGLGGEMGWVLGDREQTVLSFAVREASLNSNTVFFTAGIGFQI